MDNCSIDSMSLFIPMAEIKVIEESLISRFSNETLISATYDSEMENILQAVEIDNPRKGSSYVHEHKNAQDEVLYSTCYKYVEINQIALGDHREVLRGFQIAVHSKLLHESYFEGINEQTLDIAYDRIISQGVLSFSLDSFLSGIASDYDLKHDYVCKDFTNYTRLVHSNVNLPYQAVAKKMKVKGSLTGCRIFRRGHRENPYFKLYNKPHELFTKSHAFAAEYLSGVDVPDARVEINYPNAKTSRKYRLLEHRQDRTLQTLVRCVAQRGLESMARIQREYISMVMFGSSHSEMSGIEGNEPPASVMKKVDEYLALAFFSSATQSTATLSFTIENMKIWVRKDNFRYVRNYVITKYSEHYFDADLLKMRR